MILEKDFFPHTSKAPSLAAAIQHLAQREFIAPAFLRNGHVMTIISNFWKRDFQLQGWPPEVRYFQTTPEVRVQTFCHWQPVRQSAPTVIIIHGLEGNASRHYVLGTAEKALQAGFNAIRLNVRNCGDTEHLSPTLYHSGLTEDLHAITRELIERDGLPQIFLIGFSMGGNQSLKFAGEFADNAPPPLCGIVAISPPIDLQACCDAIAEPRNVIYQQRFLRSLKARMRRKEKLFPGICDLDRLEKVRDLRAFDDLVTAPFFGFGDANGYYARASSLPFLPHIHIPTMILTAKDDPFIPHSFFADARLQANSQIALSLQTHGGHVGFIAQKQASSATDRFWAERQAVDFCLLLSRQSVV